MTARRPSLIFVREWDQQLSASGCCGRIEGDFLHDSGESPFPDRRAGMEGMGPLYQGLRVRFGDAVELTVLDPRSLSLFFLIFRDAWAHRIGVRALLSTLFRIPVQGIVLNGRLFSGGAWPTEEEAVAAVERELTGGQSGTASTAEAAGGVTRR